MMWVHNVNRAEVTHIVENMREVERRTSKSISTGQAIEFTLNSAVAWVCGLDNTPIAVIGFVTKGTDWHTYMIATDDFDTIAAPIAKFIRRQVIPSLKEHGVKRVFSTSPNAAADAWHRLLGFRPGENKQWIWEEVGHGV